MTFLQRQKYGDNKKISEYQVGGGKERRIGRAQRNFRATETILYDIVAVEHVIIHGVNPLDL